jgi:hypothetical protein
MKYNLILFSTHFQLHVKGIKTNIYTLGFDSTIVYQDVHSEQTASKVETILDWAQEAGKDTGQVFYWQSLFVIFLSPRTTR